jgi:hypothetical protein
MRKAEPFGSALSLQIYLLFLSCSKLAQVQSCYSLLGR